MLSKKFVCLLLRSRTKEQSISFRCSSGQQLSDSHCCMVGLSEGRTLAPLARLTSRSWSPATLRFLPQPYSTAVARQGKRRPRSNTCNRHRRHNLCSRSPPTWRSNISKLAVYPEGRPQVSAQLRDQHTSKVQLRPTSFGPHSVRVHQKVLLAPSIDDAASSAPQVFNSVVKAFSSARMTA